MTKIKTHLVFPTALHIFNHSMDTSEKQTMLDYIKGTRNKETIAVSGLSKHTKNNLVTPLGIKQIDKQQRYI